MLFKVCASRTGHQTLCIPPMCSPIQPTKRRSTILRNPLTRVRRKTATEPREPTAPPGCGPPPARTLAPSRRSPVCPSASPLALSAHSCRAFGLWVHFKGKRKRTPAVSERPGKIRWNVTWTRDEKEEGSYHCSTTCLGPSETCPAHHRLFVLACATPAHASVLRGGCAGKSRGPMLGPCAVRRSAPGALAASFQKHRWVETRIRAGFRGNP